MKNLHLIPTDKPSKLHLGHLGLVLCGFNYGLNTINGQHIYITSDEEIKEGDWVIKISSLYKGGGNIQKHSFVDVQFEDITFKKIILTTDQDLIKDGVQAIDDEFLEWFVKNPSCEEVEVQCRYNFYAGQDLTHYKLIIPKEEPTEEAKQRAENYMSLKGALEPKKETLEEYAETISDYIKRVSTSANESVGIMKGAKWQQKRSYSEEDMINFAWFLIENLGQYSCDRTAHFEGKYLEQFKKK